MSFRSWLLARQLRNQGSLGAFARAVAADVKTNSVQNTLAAWSHYLGGSKHARVLDVAWQLYGEALERARKKQREPVALVN